MSERATDFRCGFVAVVGRPNVGKSTLINSMLGQKLSITSRKPQTTRHRIMGIKTTREAQIIFVDTPGIHAKQVRALNRYLNRTATQALSGVDLCVFVTVALRWEADDELVLARMKERAVPCIVVVNKIDRVADKTLLLPYLESIAAETGAREVVPVSALKQRNVKRLEGRIAAFLPAAEPVFPAGQLSDRGERFFAAELVREQLVRRLGQELPYQLSVEVEQFEMRRGIAHIGVVVWVERTGHKAIVIGKRGERLKGVGIAAREGLQTLLGRKVFIQIWVKVKQGWSDSERALRELGYTEEH